MSTIPFLVPFQQTIAGNQSFQFTYSVPNAWKVHFSKWWAKSAGAFSIFQLQDNSGLSYANVTQSAPLLSDFIQDPTNPYGGFYCFEIPIDLAGGKIIQISVLDTSGSSNLVQMLLSGTADLP